MLPLIPLEALVVQQLNQLCRARCSGGGVGHRLDDVMDHVADAVAGRQLFLPFPRVHETSVHARPIGQRALQVLADVIVQPDRASRQVQFDQAEVVEPLRQILDRRVLQPPQRAEHTERDVGVLVQHAELQASLPFVGEKPEADLDGIADGAVPDRRVLLVERNDAEILVLPQRPIERVVNGLPERDLLRQRAIRELEQQRHAFEALRQQR